MKGDERVFIKKIVIIGIVFLIITSIFFSCGLKKESSIESSDELYKTYNSYVDFSRYVAQKQYDENGNEIITEWKIEIPRMNLIANIAEGTSKEILDEFVGHFENTKRRTGNIVLAAHNRGYRVNYFSKLKELSIGDEIKYKYNEYEASYKVVSKEIITDTDLSILENTKEDIITLITCVEDKPSLRRCVKGIKIE